MESMQYDFLIFDLDGTISDPKDGIVRSFNYSLEHHGFETRNEEDIAICIGPPLDKTFSHLTRQTDKRLLTSLVSKYRERYAEVGYSENVLYDGIRESLTELHKTDKSRLAICTSKRADFAEKILKMFGLLDMFEFVNGGDIGVEKWQQLGQLLSDSVISRESIMIGDRSYDLVAAHKNNLQSAGVLWGYGSKAELLKENPKHLFSNPAQLMELQVFR